MTEMSHISDGKRGEDESVLSNKNITNILMRTFSGRKYKIIFVRELEFHCSGRLF